MTHIFKCRYHHDSRQKLMCLDAMAAYRVPVGKTRLTTQVNINNLLDKGYYTGAGYGRDSTNTGNPLSVMGSIRLQF